MLPSDFDILRPSSSMMKPWVSTARNGGAPRVPRPTSSELWNQPRCWSLPSRYMSAGHVSSGRTAARPRGSSPNRTRRRGCSSPARTPCRRTSGTQPGGHELVDRPLVPRVGAVLSNTVAALLDERRREDRFAAPRAVERRDRHAPRALARDAPVGAVRDHVVDAVVAPRRDPLHVVIDRVERRLAQRLRRAAIRRDDRSPSIRMNHCDVARKITGLWQRQQCGYVCANGSSMPEPRRARCSASTTFGFASNTCSPANNSTSSRNGRPDRPARRSRGRTSCRC